MSYEIYGSFNILNAETRETDEQAEQKFAEFAEKIEDDDLRDILSNDMASGSSCGDRIDKAVKQFTAENKGVLVEFNASDSEGQPNYWTSYYKDGKMQECRGELIYPPYDPEKLE